jgi:hypothetical protein
MHYTEQWKALSARIHGLTEAAEQDARFFGLTNSGNWRFLSSQTRELIESIATFKSTLDSAHVPSAARAIGRVLFLDRILAVQEKAAIATAELEVQTVRSCLVALRAFDAELTYLLSDNQQALRARSERAFQHLARQIVVDEEVRKRWQLALGAGEVRCELLGAVHLLAHGIYAFKADAKGARTDLIFTEPRDVGSPETYADALVLTEWKVARDQRPAEAKFIEAKVQAQQYATGALAGNELRTYRYVIVVTERRVVPPPDELINGVTFRCLNIAVNPESPSRVARRERIRRR